MKSSGERKEAMKKKWCDSESERGLAIGLALGVGVGLALGNIALGIGVGLCLGLTVFKKLGSEEAAADGKESEEHQIESSDED